MGSNKTTIKDIARDCGVGIGTVSRAINGQSGVKDEIRRKILQYVEDIGWRSNNLYSRLSISVSGRAVVFIASTSTLEKKFDNNLTRTLLEMTVGAGYSPLMLYGQCRENLERCMKINPHAVILIGVGAFQKELVGKLLRAGIRVVGVGECDEFAGPIVFPAHRKAAFQAIKLLKKVGHEKIGFLGGMGMRKSLKNIEDVNIRYIREMLYGISEAHAEFNSEFDAVSDCFSDLSILKKKLKSRHHTAWLCSDEKICRQFLHCAAELEILIPDDVSLVSITPDLPFYAFEKIVTRYYPNNSAQALKVMELIDSDVIVQPVTFISDCLFHKGTTIQNLLTKGKEHEKI